MIIGVAATKSAIVIAETKSTGDKFAIAAIRPVPFEVQTGDHLAELLRCLTAIFECGVNEAARYSTKNNEAPKAEKEGAVSSPSL